MLLRVTLTICIIFALWAPAFGTVYTVKGSWGAEVRKCHGDRNEIRTYDIMDPKFNNLTYDFFNKNVIVKTHGSFVLKVTVVDAIATKSLLLNKFHQTPNEKIYEGELHIVGYDLWEKHVTHAGVKFTIPRFGVPQLWIYVYAGAWHADYCAHVISTIQSLKIVN